MSAPADPLNLDQGDRFSFALFIALAVHLLIILGITFRIPDPQASNSSLAVTLVTHRSDTTPEDADFLAQSDQMASGTEPERRELTTTQISPFSGPLNQPLTMPAQAAESQQTDATVLASLAAINTTPLPEPQADPGQQEQRQTAPQLSAESLMAQLDALRQEYARQPRIATLTSVAARASDEAAYQVMLQERIVATGNRNYPAESLRQQLFGSVRLKLQILPDGRLETAEILESSGHLVLDRAAIDIARMAGPFPPFPDDLRSRYDKLIFIRSWQFLPGGSLSTGK